MKNFFKAKIRYAAIAFAALLMCVCAVFAGITINSESQTASAMTTTSVTNVYGGGDIWNSSKEKFDKKGVQALLVALGKGAGATSDTKSYKALENIYSAPVTATTIASKNGGANGLVVTLGGKKWTVTYLSKDNNGDLIATLWYADTETNSYFSANTSGTAWRSNNTANGYSGYTRHSNHYGGSYLRAVTLGNGGDFWSASGTSVQTNSAVTKATATAAQVSGSAFYQFAQGAISEYLDAPNDVSWQQVEYNSSFSSYRTQNDNLTAQTANWYNSYINNSQNDELYYQWGADKIWLPSIPETGWNASNTGIWGTTTEQRKSASSASYSWLRSGYYDYAYGAYVLYSSGGNSAALRTIRMACAPRFISI